MENYENQLEKADELRKQGKNQESLSILKKHLLKNNVLLWYAKLTENPNESIAAADLALKLEPENEMAQRAISTVRKQLPKDDIQHEDMIKTVIESTGMTLIQARSVKWPFRNINLPIGEAYDSKVIDLRDLAWASENAYNENISNAAKTVLLSKLLEIEPTNLPPTMKIFSCSRYSEIQERRSFMITGLLMGIVLTLSVLPTILMIGGFFGFFSVKTSWIGLFLFLLSIILIVYLSERFGDKAVSYKIGRWGEEKAVESIRLTLDGRWILFKNFVLPNKKKGDIDLILIGPGGIWVFEVKAYSGQIRNIGNLWQKKGKFIWYKLSTNPGKQARSNAALLKKFFSENKISVKWVNPVVLWAGEISSTEKEKGSLHVENPETPVWKVEQLHEYADEFLQTSNFNSLKNEAIDLIMKSFDNKNTSEIIAKQTEQKAS